MTRTKRRITALLGCFVIGFAVLGALALFSALHPGIKPLVIPVTTLQTTVGLEPICTAYRDWAIRAADTVRGMEELCRE